MNAQRWRQITDVFESAIDLPVHERAAYVDSACSGDPDLHREVGRMLAELEKSGIGGFLETPIGPSVAELGQTLIAGDLIANRYRIETLLGRGGMGEVYRALDTLIDEPVALKILRPELAADPSLLRRFQREVQLARRISHPNVCRVYEVGVDTATRAEPGKPAGPVHFFTMQLIPGDTLAQRIKRAGPLSKAEAFPLIRQIASGLAAAHTQGIIHRDFKSSNIILTGEGGETTPIITDFGLARYEAAVSANGTVHSQGAITINHEIAGTVPYMSPEQLSGDDLTTASDLYSFGIVLYEMATGRLPFPSTQPVQAALERKAPPPAANIDAQWQSAVERCLHPDHTKRPTAQALFEHFRPAWRPPMAYWSRRDWTKAAAAAGIIGTGVSLGPTAFRFFTQDAKLPEGSEALLSPITNLTGDARFDGITELFRNQLAQSVHINLIGSDKLSSTLQQMGKPDSTDPNAIREASWRMNAIASIYGTVSRVGPDFALNVQLETRGNQPNAPKTKLLKTFSASDETTLMRSVRDASVWTREQVGESAKQINAADKLPSDVTTPSWEALSAFARGEQVFFSQNYQPAIDYYDEALSIDPKFSLAAFRKADLLHSKSRQGESFALWRSAFKMLGNRSITRREEFAARSMFAFDSGDIDSNDKYCRLWTNEYPNDWRASYNRVIGLILGGFAKQALELLAPLRQQRPDFGDLYAQTIAAHLVLGNTDEAREFIPSLRRLNYPERADLREGFVRFREGNFVGYLEALRSIQQSENRRSAADATLHEAMLCIDCNIPAAAAQRVDAFIAQDGPRQDTMPEYAQLRIVQAWAEMLDGKRERALNLARRAINIDSNSMILALAGSIFARLHSTAEAREATRLCADFLDLNIYRIAHYRINGEIKREREDVEGALRAFRDAASLEPSIAHRQYLIEALPIRDEERIKLCRNAASVPWQSLRPPPLHNLGSLVSVLETDRAAPDSFNDFTKTIALASSKLRAAV